MKKWLPFVLILAAASSFAANDQFTKSEVPRNIILAGFTGSSRINVLVQDFPVGVRNKKKNLLGLDYQTTFYPNNTGETVELCYYPPYASTQIGCVDIAPSSSGTVNAFNSQTFNDGVQVEIRHKVTGGTFPGLPATYNTVTFRYSYE